MLTKQKPRPICANCGLVPVKYNGKSKLGFKKWHKYCIDCSKILYSKKHKHLQNKKLICEKCNFKPEDKVQLDLIYKDSNKRNKKSNNFVTLCANCSRLYKKRLKTNKKSVMNMTVDSDIIIS